MNMNGLPIVSKCDEIDCFYNRGGCHAPAINVGSSHPMCDTFSRTGGGKHTSRQPAGLVGACHVAECRWNADLTCVAKAISVGPHGDHPDCLTFEART
jgi:hypothetical protein